MLQASLRRWVWSAALIVVGSSAACVSEDDPVSTAQQGVAVTWTNVVGATATANNLIKTAGIGWGNSGASSMESISSDGFAEWTTAESNLGKSAGLSVGDSTQHHNDIDFSINLGANSRLYVYEAGVLAGQFGTYAAGDTLRVETVEREVRYLRNGAVVHVSPKANAFPLVLDTALYHTNATIQNAQISDYVFTNTVGVTVAGNNLTKTGAPDGWNTAGAISVRTIKDGDGYVEFTTGEATLTKSLGLSATDADQHNDSIQFAIQLTNTGTVQVYESGALRGSFGAYAAGDLFRVEILNGFVRYRRNGVVLYTSATAPTYPLFADAALFHAGATLQGVNLVDTFFTSVVGAEAIGNKLFAAGATGWGNAGAVSIAQVASGDAYVEFTTGETNRGKSAGLSNGNTNQHYNDIDFAISLGANASVQVHENGALRGTFGTYTTSDVFRVDLTAGVVTYRRNGTTFYTSTRTPTYPLLVDTALFSQVATIKNVTFVGTAASAIPRDPISGWAVPLTQADWDAVFAAAGVTPKTVGQSWALQDAGGDPVATIGSPLLASTGAVALDYLQAVTGWDRDAIMMSPDGAQEFLKQGFATGPNPTTESVLSFVYASMDPMPVATTRRMVVIAGQANNEVLLGMTNVAGALRYRLVCDAVATLGTSTSAAGPVRPLFLQYDRTAARVRAYTDQEIITGTYSTGITSSTKGLGTSDNAGTSGVQRNLLGATFSGANAEWTEAEMRAVYNVMINAPVPW